MPQSCLLYYITDRTAFRVEESSRRRRLLDKIAEAARAEVDYIQLREKDLSTRELESLAREAVSIIREYAQLKTGRRELRPALLINSRTDVAIAVQADGVHLRSDDIDPKAISNIWQSAAVGSVRQLSPQRPMIGVSCHSPAEVAQAADNGATFAVFAPIFEKKDAPTTPPSGLALLEKACHTKIPVLALGGITLSNAHSCLEAGAAGIAGIRLFQENDVDTIVQRLRSNH